MCGVPASKKTTTAMRLHAQLGVDLIRSGDIYQERGIAVPEWVRPSAGFTRNVSDYESVRDCAYAEMARRAELSLASGTPLVIVDGIHGERVKRQRRYEI
jgi:predicted kinase